MVSSPVVCLHCSRDEGFLGIGYINRGVGIVLSLGDYFQACSNRFLKMVSRKTSSDILEAKGGGARSCRLNQIEFHRDRPSYHQALKQW